MISSSQIIPQDKLEAFLDELTMLTRKFQLIISSEGSRDIPAIRVSSHQEVNQGRYEPFFNLQEQEAPVEFVFVELAELENIIDIDKL